MSTTTSNFVEGVGVYEDARRVARRWNPVPKMRTLWDALGEGLAAANRYHDLTRRGMSHAEAASKVFNEHYEPR